MALAPVSFEDFSGGLTDKYVGTDTTRAAWINNLLIDETKKPYTRPGTSIFASRLPVATNATKPTGSYIGPNPFARPFFVVGPHGYTMAASSFTEVVGPASNSFLPTKTDATYESLIQWRRQLIAAYPVASALPQMVYCSGLSPYQLKALTLGLPSLANAPTFLNTGTTHTYAYQFFYKYTFTDYTGTTFEFLGNPNNCVLEVETTNTPDATTLNFTALPVLANSSLTNYDVANITIEVYRTIDGGQNYFFNQSIANGTTTFSDSMSDTVLATGAPIYTAGGAVGFDQPPTNAVAVTEVNSYFWWATSHALYQSINGAPGGVPASFLEETDQTIKGLNNFSSFPILFCDKSVYRIEGNFDSFGNNGFAFRTISKTAGCVSNNSIVAIPQGLVWFGNGGIYFTDGYQAILISRHLRASYKTWRNAKVAGAFDPTTNVVHWTVSGSGNGSITANDTLLSLHLDYGLKPESTFTTSTSENNFYPSSLTFSQSDDITDAGAPYASFFGRILFTDAQGYVLWFDPAVTTDPKIDTALSPSSFVRKSIIYDLQTAGLDQGTIGFRKYTSDVSVEVDNITSVALQIQHRRDDGGPWSGTGGTPPYGVAGTPGGGSSGNPGVPEIRNDSAIVWGVTDCAWGTDTLEHPWNSQATLEETRTMPNDLLRSGRRQLRFTNAFTVICGSDQYGLASVSATARTVTLNTVGTIWPSDLEDYFITFAADSYNQTFQIKTRTSDTVIEVYDPYALLTLSAATKWEIKGYRKFEQFRLVSFTLYSDVDGNTYAQAQGQTGANA